MKKIKIEKTVAGELIEKFEIPVLLLNLSAKFLPQAALKELEERGIDINTMLEVAKADGKFASNVEVIENNIKTNVFISLV
ncbi:hypothetical protein [Entomomonas asaccharolytica]|uniref:Uncharacterized protein n=1 Tax=Entomomonas asaccharolytica TaxID=2785331 RepID=A0A974ND81_9GAMM|nr:hypothetical protein [Entomomonas asaccharolytica]QQP84342.1 hypothetical protein JHT90_07845 [Entomomonas asaccharolytica]